MSRVGKQPVEMPKGVQASITGNMVSIQGPKGKLEYQLGRGISVKVDGTKLHLSATVGEDAQIGANWGSARATINNMVFGVNTGWTRNLELQGVGYGATVAKNSLKLNVGYSHEVVMPIPQGVSCKIDKNIIVMLESADKQVLGNFASNIRKVRPPEPYLGKGIRIVGETVRRKAGKAGKK
ncbi:MAG: 50S ribosomal protein L6 [bacterium]|nr:50S ribosomal protein L6 [bacterium]